MMAKSHVSLIAANMRILFVLVVALFPTMIQVYPWTKDIQPDVLFSGSAEAKMYWKALAAVANNNRQKALDLIDAAQSGKSYEVQTDTYECIDDVFDDLFLVCIKDDPQDLTALRLFESIGVFEHNGFLNNVSPRAIRSLFEQKQQLRAHLQKYDIQSLNQDQKISNVIFAWLLDLEAENEKFMFHEYKITQMYSIISDFFSLMTTVQPLQVIDDFIQYNERLKRFPQQIDQTIAYLDIQKKKHIRLPAFVIKKVISNLEGILLRPAVTNVLYTHFAEKLSQISMKKKDHLLAITASIVHNQVYPALRKICDYFKVMQKTCFTNHGVWALPSGDDYYVYMLKRHTTTDLSPEEIHQLGLQEVAKIHAQMRELLASQGIIDESKSVGALLYELSQNSDFYFSNDAHGRELCIKRFEEILDRCRTELHPLFDLKPNYLVQLQQVPQHEQDGMPLAYYRRPSIDGSRPGMFFVNMRNMNEIPTYGMETLAVHEAEPGHHFQIALQQESKMPIMRKMGEYTAYIEGWALYVEKLAHEQGFYSSAWSKLGHLQDELLRAVRLVLDTGIHKYHWSRNYAIDYMQEVTGYHHDSVVTEVERYFVMPGQACSYKIGQLKILELRTLAMNELGDTFDIREFHNVVLKLGAAPLAVLEEVVKDYIAAKKS